MTPHKFFFSLAALALLCPARADDTKQPTADDIAKAEKAVKDFLEKHKATFGQVTHVKDDAVAKTFPGTVLFTAHFRQYPIAREMPEPLKYANVFAVGKDGKPLLVNEGKAMQKFFQENARGANKEAATNVLFAWLKLSPELQQDGFYKFVVQEKGVEVSLPQGGGVQADGKSVVMQGGNGEIVASLVFDKDGKLAKIDEKSSIKPGPRPICQATKLLDPDPVVRKMAEQDLLIMGRAAKPYLDEQRARATAELQRAIDRIWQRIVERDN